ncbi:MAG: hypothetical protein H0X62_03065 [Bacteroidetes bacterium]|nr:hypothetical protein [Bacteroidota bacterium]
MSIVNRQLAIGKKEWTIHSLGFTKSLIYADIGPGGTMRERGDTDDTNFTDLTD